MSMLSAVKTPSISGDKKESIKSALSSSSGKRSIREKSNKSNASQTNEKEIEWTVV